MLSYCLEYRKNTKNSKVASTKNGRIMLWAKCAVCNSKKLKLLKEQEAKSLSNFPGAKIPFLNDSSVLSL